MNTGRIKVDDLVSIPGYPKYLLSKEGLVYSKKVSKVMKFDIIKGGYLRVLLYNNDGPKRFMIHRLVALVFLPNPDNKAEVNHKNGNKNDNSLGNLEWNTTKENHKHA
jgi:hypothetical protein